MDEVDFPNPDSEIFRFRAFDGWVAINNASLDDWLAAPHKAWWTDGRKGRRLTREERVMHRQLFGNGT